MTSNDWDREERSALEPFEAELRLLRDRHASDPPLDVLRAAAGEVLPDDLQASTAAHLANSRWSRALVEGANDGGGGLAGDDEARLLARITREGRAGGERAGWPPRIWWSLIATGGAIALVFVMVLRSGPPARDAEVASRTVSSAPAPAAPATPTFALTLDKPAVKLSPRAFTYRGDADGTDFVSQLKPALDAYRQDDFERANTEFSALAKRYPQAVEIGFYQGVARLFLNDFTGADASLAAADQIDRNGDASFAADIAWYRAIADERLGRVTDARARLTALCGQINRPRQAAACEARDRLK